MQKNLLKKIFKSIKHFKFLEKNCVFVYSEFVNVAHIFFQLIGSLGFLLYGMSLMSGGIQKSAGEKLQSALDFMTGNRFVGLLTGMIVTMFIQSSGATTVMIVSVVNAGLLTLTQAIGVIFGANIGTTITAWIVALFGFNFNIEAIAMPLFGFGFVLSSTQNHKYQNFAEAIMGFALLFVGLSMLSKTITIENAPILSMLSKVQAYGIFSLAIALLVSIGLTALIHSSSALTAIILTMAHNNLLTWEFACAMVIGSNIGSTIDSILASLGAKVHAKRASLVHVLFNVSGAVLSLALFHPLLSFVDFLIPGEVMQNITYHIAMMHTTFNVMTAIVFLPFVKPLARLTEYLIPEKKTGLPSKYTLEQLPPKASVQAGIIRVEKEIADMTEIVSAMFNRIQEGFQNRNQSFIDKHILAIAQAEEYVDEMHIQLSHYIVECEQLPANEHQRNNLSVMFQIIDELETMSDDCLHIALLLQKSITKKMVFVQDDMEKLIPYIELARQFLQFIHTHINKHLTNEQLAFANSIEMNIDKFHKSLKKTARKRLESGADVRSELLYIDLVRHIEKFGDRAFAISELLSQTA